MRYFISHVNSKRKYSTSAYTKAIILFSSKAQFFSCENDLFTICHWIFRCLHIVFRVSDSFTQNIKHFSAKKPKAANCTEKYQRHSKQTKLPNARISEINVKWKVTGYLGRVPFLKLSLSISVFLSDYLILTLFRSYLAKPSKQGFRNCRQAINRAPLFYGFYTPFYQFLWDPAWIKVTKHSYIFWR